MNCSKTIRVSSKCAISSIAPVGEVKSIKQTSSSQKHACKTRRFRRQCGTIGAFGEPSLRNCLMARIFSDASLGRLADDSECRVLLSRRLLSCKRVCRKVPNSTSVVSQTLTLLISGILVFSRSREGGQTSRSASLRCGYVRSQAERADDPFCGDAAS